MRSRTRWTPARELDRAHGFKLAAYLDDNLRHSILRLAHAHGLILALVVLGFASSLPPGDGDGARAARLTGLLLRAGAMLIPLGFALGGIAPHEGDPGFPVVLVPVGGLLLVAGLARLAWSSWRKS